MQHTAESHSTYSILFIVWVSLKLIYLESHHLIFRARHIMARVETMQNKQIQLANSFLQTKVGDLRTHCKAVFVNCLL